ncbi:MAG: hypothetical protein ACLPWF_10620 [Bryobacteraceae bacterium]
MPLAFRSDPHCTTPVQSWDCVHQNKGAPEFKNEAGKDLVRAIFGTDAIAEDTLL